MQNFCSDLLLVKEHLDTCYQHVNNAGKTSILGGIRSLETPGIAKWYKAFWAKGYYVEIIGNITEEAVQKYIKVQVKESRKKN